MKSHIPYLLAGALPLAASLITAAPAMAQASPPTATSGALAAPSATTDAAIPGSGAAQPGEIVVTALKSSGTVQKTPAAITALPADTLTKIGASSLTAIQEVTPALQIAPTRTQALIFLRGVGTTLTSPNADPAVAVNINGAYIPTEMTATGFFDLDRIEVLPGPQGTLYGGSSAGGVVNLVTRKPGDTTEADGFVEIGNYSRVQAQVGVDTPITSNLSLRTALTWISHSGYDSNGGDDQDTKAGRMTAVWKPTDRTTVTAVATYSKDSGIGPLGFNNPASYGGYRNLDFDPHALGFYIDNRVFTSTVQVNQKISDTVSLTYIGGYDNLYQNDNTASWTGPPLADLYTSQRNRTTTQELRADAKFGNFSAIAGLYYFHTDAQYTSDNTNLGVIGDNGPWEARSHGYAVFAQGTYKVSDVFRVTGGGRFSWTDKSLAGSDASGTAAKLTYLDFIGSKNLSHADWKVGAEYDVAPRSMLYANIETGFIPGGLSTAPVSKTDVMAQSFSPVYLTAYTAGTKNRFFGNLLTINVEGFYYDYRNYQVSARDPVTSQNIIYNAPKARIYGVQADAHLRFTPDDDLSAGVSAQNAKAITLVTPSCNCSGYQLPFAPNATWIGSYQHTFHLGNLGTLETLANGEWISSRWGLYTHATGTFVHPTHTLDLTATYRPNSRNVSFALWMRNVTNSYIPTYIGTAPAPAGPGTLYLAPPRTFGARLGFQY